MIRCSLLIIISFIFLSACMGQNKDYVITIKTPYGDMVAILYDETPKHKENFIKLAKAHYYDSLLFHRVIEGFMIQGGDPDSKNAKPGFPLGQGGPGYTIDAEINPQYFHEKGALAAARLGDQANPMRASSGSQFYIVQGKKYSEMELGTDMKKFSTAFQQFIAKPENKMHSDSLGAFYRANNQKGYENYILKLKPIIEEQTGIDVDKPVSPELVKAYTTNGGALHLDGQYTVFGKVIKGIEIVDKIAAVKKDRDNRPLEDIRMIITVEELPKKKIEKLYGYQYPEKIKVK